MSTNPHDSPHYRSSEERNPMFEKSEATKDPSPIRPSGPASAELKEYQESINSAVNLVAMAARSSDGTNQAPIRTSELAYSVPGTIAMLREANRKIEDAIDALQRAAKTEKAAGETAGK